MIQGLVEKFKGCIPGISLDCVVFGYQNRRLHVLLLKYKNSEAWALPGGFLPSDAEMDTEIGSILKDRTGVDHIFLHQFHTFSSLDRNWEHTPLNRATFESIKTHWPLESVPFLENWFQRRFISTAYFALIDCQKVHASPDFLSESCEWVSVKELPPLILDHKHMIEKALTHLRQQINFLPIGKELLAEKFTMLDLQSLYEAILDKKLDRGNFQRKIMKLGMLIRHEKMMTGAKHKAPYLYSIDAHVYDQLVENGIGFG